MAEITELKDRRQYLKGGDKNSINRHSSRFYSYGGRLFMLDRTLDAVPPIFELTLVPEKPGLHETIKVEGKQYWGDGLSWQKAEKLAKEAITSHQL